MQCDDDRQQEDDVGEEVVRALRLELDAEERELADSDKAGRAAGDADPVREHVLHDEDERERGQREIEALEAKDRAGCHREDGGREDGDAHCHVRTHAVILGEHCARIRTDGEERRLSERQQARQPEQEVERNRDRGEDQRKHERREVPRVDHEDRGQDAHDSEHGKPCVELQAAALAGSGGGEERLDHGELRRRGDRLAGHRPDVERRAADRRRCVGDEEGDGLRDVVRLVHASGDV